RVPRRAHLREVPSAPRHLRLPLLPPAPGSAPRHHVAPGRRPPVTGRVTSPDGAGTPSSAGTSSGRASSSGRGAAARPLPTGTSTSMRARRRRETVAGYALLAPSLIGLVAFLLVPVVLVLVLSLTDYRIAQGTDP